MLLLPRRRAISASRPSHVAIVGLALLAACDRSLPVAPPGPPVDLEQFVAGEAARALNADGRFSLAAPDNPGNAPMVRAERAGDLAKAYIRTFGPFLKDEFEKDRGARIDLSGLEVDPNIHFARTPYGPFPDGFHPAIGRVFGPYYLVTLNSGSEPVLVIAVSAYTTDVGIDAKGELQLPWRSGNEFVPVAVAAPSRTQWGYRPNLPEQAVAHVGRMTGARTIRVPELMRVDRRWHPAYAIWRLELDRGITVRTPNGARRENIRVVFVGPASRLYVPAGNQPTQERFDAPLLTGPAEPTRTGTVSLVIQHPTKYEEVTLDEQAR